MAVELGVEPPSVSRWSLPAKEPFEDRGHCTGDHSPDYDAPPRVSPGGVSPDEDHNSPKQPKWTVATVSGDECQQTQKARLAWNGEARRHLSVESDELL